MDLTNGSRQLEGMNPKLERLESKNLKSIWGTLYENKTLWSWEREDQVPTLQRFPPRWEGVDLRICLLKDPLYQNLYPRGKKLPYKMSV